MRVDQHLYVNSIILKIEVKTVQTNDSLLDFWKLNVFKVS